MATYSPFLVAKKLANEYREVLRSVFSPRRGDLREVFERILNEEGFLIRDIFLQILPVYERTSPITELAPEVRQWFGEIAESPYKHQVEATRKLLEGKPVLIATGTGSGKTEAFLMPIVDWCYRHRGERGVKAILLYPMNALINNQRDRLGDSLGARASLSGDTRARRNLRGKDLMMRLRKKGACGQSFGRTRPTYCLPTTRCWTTCSFVATVAGFSRTTKSASSFLTKFTHITASWERTSLF